MNDVEREVEFWDGAANAGLQVAIDKIAADPSAWEGRVLEECLEEILPHVLPAIASVDRPRVLDLGCGAGRLTIPLATGLPFATIVGLDLSAGMLKLGRELAAGLSNIEWVLGDGRTIPRWVGPLHAAFSMLVFQHIPRPAQESYLAEVSRLLVPGGVFRFQLYEGTADEFLTHQVDEAWVRQACHAAQLELCMLSSVPTNTGEGRALWVTARKR